MAKFCSKCGKSLEDGKPCSCESTVTTSASQKGFGEMLKEYWELVKRVFKEPVTMVEENNSEDKFNIALVSIGVSSIMMGLFYCLFIKATIGSLSSMVDIPYLKIFLFGFVIMAGLLAVLAIVGYFSFATLFKANTTIKKMFVLIGLTTIVEAIALAGCSVLTLFKLSETVIYCIYGLVAISAILSMVYFVKSVDNYAKVNADKLGYAVVIMYAVTTVIAYLVLTNINYSSLLA